jgi:hypothetical protein
MQAATAEKTITLISRVRYREIGGEGVLVHLDNGRVIVVNELGLYIVQQLAKPITRSHLTAAIIKQYEVTVDQAEADLKLFLDQLDQEQVLDYSE